NSANGNWYQLVISTGGWLQANADANAMTFQGIHGHLATITSPQELTFIAGAFPGICSGDPQYWIGGYQDPNAPDYSEPAGGWRWVTGEPWSSYANLNWRSGEPNNQFGIENYLLLNMCQWNDGRTNDFAQPGFIVEFENPCQAN